MDTLLFWKVGCTQFMNPRWTNQETVEYVYEIWPFNIDYNPRYLEKKLRYNLSCAAGHGYSGQSEEWRQMFGLRANLACEQFIDQIFEDQPYWDPKPIGNEKERKREREKRI